MMKKMKTITALLTFIAGISVPIMRYISSSMQAFYKSQMDDFTKNTSELLSKKMFWANISDSWTPILFKIFYVFVFLLLLLLFINWILDRKKKTESQNQVDVISDSLEVENKRKD